MKAFGRIFKGTGGRMDRDRKKTHYRVAGEGERVDGVSRAVTLPGGRRVVTLNREVYQKALRAAARVLQKTRSH